MTRLDCRKFHRLQLHGFVVLVLGFALLTGPNGVIAQTSTPQAPPPAPPIQFSGKAGSPRPQPQTPTLYSIGQPTDEEQLYLEYLNRMRANPTAEGNRLANTTDTSVLAAYSQFSVDLSLMEYEFSTNPAVPPLAMNAELINSARLHSEDMFTKVYQGHFETNSMGTNNPGTRITAQGYNWSAYGENVFSFASSVFFGHAGFAVDWGNLPGGMQIPPGHRDNMFSSNLREVGVGVVDGMNSSNGVTVGPQLVTQDFGQQLGATPFITGVAYYDVNSNAFYDMGEGIPGVTVTAAGSSYYASTANSGGYAIPIPGNGTYTVTFTATGLSNQVSVVVSGNKNVKVDYVPAYSPPVVSGPNPAGLNSANMYTFTAVGGATAYQWQATQFSPYTNVEGAENGLSNVTANISSGYSVIDTDYHYSGTHSFHLAMPDTSNQYLTLNPTLQVGASSMLSFAKLLGYAGDAQVAEAQVSADGGMSWQTVWSETGSGGSGDSGMTVINVSLSAYAGQFIQVRFAYILNSGNYFPQTDPGVGFYIDAISVSNASLLLGSVVNNVTSGTSFTFTPTNSNNYLLQVRAQIGSRTLPWGPVDSVTVGPALPSIQVVSRPTVSGTQVMVDFTVANYRSGMTFQLWKGTNVFGTWSQDASASLSTLTAGSKYRLTTTLGTGTRMFYKVKGSF